MNNKIAKRIKNYYNNFFHIKEKRIKIIKPE